MGGGIIPPLPLVTLVFLKVEGAKFGDMGYFDVLSSKMALVFKFRASIMTL